MTRNIDCLLFDREVENTFSMSENQNPPCPPVRKRNSGKGSGKRNKNRGDENQKKKIPSIEVGHLSLRPWVRGR